MDSIEDLLPTALKLHELFKEYVQSSNGNKWLTHVSELHGDEEIIFLY